MCSCICLFHMKLKWVLFVSHETKMAYLSQIEAKSNILIQFSTQNSNGSLQKFLLFIFGAKNKAIMMHFTIPNFFRHPVYKSKIMEFIKTSFMSSSPSNSFTNFRPSYCCTFKHKGRCWKHPDRVYLKLAACGPKWRGVIPNCRS